MVLAMSTGLMAQTYSGGSGTSEVPYQIANKADLKYLSENTGEWSKHFKQTANIIFASSDFESGGDFYNSGAGFIPIGNGAVKFTGTYDGDGHTIDNLFINRSSTGHIGLFGYISNATIQNIGVTNIDITGNDYVGGLVGSNNESTVSNSYSTGSVSGDYYVGGLVGYNIHESTVSNSFWDMETSDTEIGIGAGTTTRATGKTTAEMKDVATFTETETVGLTTAWDFETNPNDDDANENYWDIDGSDAINSGYPFLSWQNGDEVTLTVFTVTHNSYVLQSAYPNPFNPTFTLPLQLNENAFVNIQLVNILGQKVLQIENSQMSIGNNDLQINCENLSSGVYFVKVTIDNVNEIQKVVLLK